jgi:3-hydroxymyristoyl/3-hydroxydecanoyl-(acyl carrier protein) dehydratase
MMPMPATLLMRDPGEAVYALALAAGLEAFHGHFPGDPVLPGVVQVDWAARLGAEAFGALGAFRGVDQLKFLAPIRPLEPLELTLTLHVGRLGFRYQSGPVLKASGFILTDATP